MQRKGQKSKQVTARDSRQKVSMGRAVIGQKREAALKGASAEGGSEEQALSRFSGSQLPCGLPSGLPWAGIGSICSTQTSRDKHCSLQRNSLAVGGILCALLGRLDAIDIVSHFRKVFQVIRGVQEWRKEFIALKESS